MPYKILIVRNNYTKKLDFKKGLDWFSKKTPLKIEIEEISTNLPTLRFDVDNKIFQGCVVNRSIYTELRKIIPENKYHCVVLINGNKMNCVRVSYADDIPIYPNTDFVQLVKVTDDGLTLNHEILHTFFLKLNRQGINVEDPMDKVAVSGVTKHYYNDKSLTAKHSNRTIALERLAPYWNKIVSFGPTADVIITRGKSDLNQTLGSLTAKQGGALFVCKTLELPDLGNKQNVSCIPKGVYDCVFTFSPKFMKYTYQILNVPKRSAIRLHVGNTFKQIAGCILLGSGLADIDRDGTIDVTNSAITIKSFEGFMQKKPFRLEIR